MIGSPGAVRPNTSFLTCLPCRGAWFLSVRMGLSHITTGKSDRVMALMHSINTSNVVQEKQGRAKWVRTMRRESPPESLDQYLQHWEAFFDHYAAQVDRWHHRNAGYHKAIASLACFYVSADARVLEIG